MIEAVGKAASLLEVAIATGRTHQIRVHAAHLGHPVAGDERYGDPEFNTALERFGLRAHVPALALGGVRLARVGRGVLDRACRCREELKDVLGRYRGSGRGSGGRPRSSIPADLSAPASQINGKPISAVGSRESMRSNNATPSPSALKLPAQS